MYRYRINAGKFKIPINIYSFTMEKDEDGINIMKKVKILSTRGKIENMKPSGTVDSDIIDYQNEKKVTIRYPKSIEITEKNILEINGRMYTIVYRDNINEENRYLMLRIKHKSEEI